MAQWIAWATKLDRQWRQRETRKKLLNISSSPSKPSRPIPTPIKPSPVFKEPDVVPMEIDSGKKKMGSPICFKCRKKGHIAKYCQSQVDIRAMDYEEIKALIQEDLKKEQGF